MVAKSRWLGQSLGLLVIDAQRALADGKEP